MSLLLFSTIVIAHFFLSKFLKTSLCHLYYLCFWHLKYTMPIICSAATLGNSTGSHMMHFTIHNVLSSNIFLKKRLHNKQSPCDMWQLRPHDFCLYCNTDSPEIKNNFNMYQKIKRLNNR